MTHLIENEFFRVATPILASGQCTMEQGQAQKERQRRHLQVVPLFPLSIAKPTNISIKFHQYNRLV